MPINARKRLRIVAAAVAILISLVAIAVVAALLLRRADITDPKFLAKMPLDELRDRELETLVRAAFRNAASVHIETEQHPRRPTHTATVTARDELDELADLFVVGGGGPPPPIYYYKRLSYVRVTFDGPYRPDFSFTSAQGIHVFDRSANHGIHSIDDSRSRSAMIHTLFSKKIVELLKLEEADNQPVTPKP